ncbi:10438_t:CDS:2, partial [Scutellospora calospora]
QGIKGQTYHFEITIFIVTRICYHSHVYINEYKKNSEISLDKCISSIMNSNIIHKESLLTMPTEAIDIIIDYLNVRDQQNLSHACQKLRRATRNFHFGVNFPIWKDITNDLIIAPPISNYRDGVVVDGKFYIVILAEDIPICWILDFTKNTIGWIQVSILISMDPSEYHPVRSTAGAAIKNNIYMFGGESRLTGYPTNIMYKLDIQSMKLYRIIVNDNYPTPRSMHSLDSINSEHIILFGGRCMMHGNKFYDTKEFFIYNVYKNLWIRYDQTTHLPYARSLHSSSVNNGMLYIYGGQHITLHSFNSSIHNDEDIWVYDSYKNTWRKYLAPMTSCFCLPEEWIATKGVGPGKRYGASIFIMRRKIIILGGTRTTKPDENMSEENGINGEYMNILCPKRRTWEHVQVKGMPQLECVAIKNRGNKIFIIGKNCDAKMVMGWIID